MHAWLAAAGGFLLAVLWMDLIFDVQVLAHPARDGDVPEPVLASIAAYYRRATTDSRPMSHLIGGVMVATLAVLLVELARSDEPHALTGASLALAGAPIALAYFRVVPNAIRLGRRADTSGTQSALARGICRDHLLCLALVLAFVALQLWTIGRGPCTGGVQGRRRESDSMGSWMAQAAAHQIAPARRSSSATASAMRR